MEPSTELTQQTVVEAINGNGVHKPAEMVQSPEQLKTIATGTEKNDTLSDSANLQQQQRPRKLSFDDTDMELTRLKLSAAVRRFPLPVVIAIVAACAMVSLLMRYLLPFDSGSFVAALAALQRWRQTVADRVVWDFDYNQRYASFQTMLKETSAQFQQPSLLLFASMLGIAVTWFTYYVVYLDSSIPGVNPPTPFSASKKKRFSDKERRFHLGYITALLSGLTVFLIILFVE